MNNLPPHGPPSALDRERDRERERDIEEQQLRERHIIRQQEEMAQREREHNERERQHREQQYQSIPQHQNNTGAIPIHQPVASRLPGAIHSPGGLLANHGASGQSGPLGAPVGPGNAFGGPLHTEGNRSIQQHNQQNNLAQQQHQMFGPNLLNHPTAPAGPHGAQGGPSIVFGGSLQPDAAARVIQQVPFGGPMTSGHQIPGAPALGQGQQPILNDALSYLDQVKVQFVDQPDVYNRFLDIMKDFKSQAIDTPGVINRVSELFAGHPNLIQGFNTFLPPGYRIECGAGNDPNTIRVTTPMGTTVQSIPGAGRALTDSSHLGINNAYYPQRGGGWQQQPQHSIESPEAVFSPQSRSGVPAYNSGPGPNATFESQQAAAVAHQQEQRGVSQLQNAVATATGHPVQRNALTPTPAGSASGMNGAGVQQPGLEKRGPVEFNHAISYVNKIKNRFQDKPEIYKQFLEILQTYQRESKPIQDVYAQVTTLFNTAPDLLEDFKQFLPESAAQAKAAAAKAAEDAAALAGVSQTPQPLHIARSDQKLPPVGNFPPPSTGKTAGGKRPRPPPAANNSIVGPSPEGNGARASIGQAQNLNKRAKISHSRPADDAPVVSPTLTPNIALPQPMPPSATSSSQQAEVAFFDKVKKYLSNKQTFAEFLKLCNLFSQDLIDRNVLVHKVSNFIGMNVELMDFFKKFVAYTGPEEVIENRPRAPSGRVALSNCRGLGPSYRLLPKRASGENVETVEGGPLVRFSSNWVPFEPADCKGMEPYDPSSKSFQNFFYIPHLSCVKRKLASVEEADEPTLSQGTSRKKQKTKVVKADAQIERAKKTSIAFYEKMTNKMQERLKACSGRDEMCYSVLNDDWASHPTWASEDSGFVAHRKNIFEEALHRIEEERHDYDFNIEANQKVIQLLEPIGQQLLSMTPEDLANFRMPINLGGSSPSIHKRILKKIYGPAKGAEVAADLFRDPVAVLPTVLARLKQKDEEWRFTQREWDKVWHAQTQLMYLKSLDHMGIHVKTADKKIFATKNIVDLIKLKHEEQRRQRSLKGRVSRYQFAYDFKDSGVIVDAIRLAVLYVTNAGQHSGLERERIAQFFERFIPLFFDISLDSVQDRVRDISRGSPEDDMEDVAPAELTNGRGRRANGKKADLLRGVLDRSRNGIKSRSQKEDSAASGSKESTPDDVSTLDDDGDAPEAPEDQAVTEVTNERWLTTIPGPGALAGTKPLEPADVELKADKLFQRDYYNLYCNQTIIVFFTLFEILYRRLKSIKDSEQDVIEEVRRARRPKPAKDIGLIDDKNEFFTDDFSGDYYSKALFVMEEFITGDMDEARYQDFFRRYYLKKGWALYTVHELLKSLCRMAAACSGSDSKDKTPDILELFAENRDKEETTYNTEINLRKQVEKYVKDGEMFLIKYHPRVHQATVQLILKDETTFELTDMERKERWKYYTSSFVRIEPTEGVPRDRVRKSVLTRNLPSGFDTDSDISGTALQQRKPILFNEDLVLQICVNTYTLMYKKGTSEWFIYNNSQDSEKAAQMTENRNQKFREKFHMNSKWMKNLSQAQVQEANQSFEKWVKDGVVPSAASASATSAGSVAAAAGVLTAALSERTVQGEE